MASLLQGALPRRREKENSYVEDHGHNVLDLEENSLWGMITSNRIKNSTKFEFDIKKMKTTVKRTQFEAVFDSGISPSI